MSSASAKKGWVTRRANGTAVGGGATIITPSMIAAKRAQDAFRAQEAVAKLTRKFTKKLQLEGHSASAAARLAAIRARIAVRAKVTWKVSKKDPYPNSGLNLPRGMGGMHRGK